jgi:hypothetical protein
MKSIPLTRGMVAVKQWGEFALTNDQLGRFNQS